jgi:transposase
MAESATTINENGTHSAWAQDVITEWGHEVLVANLRLMEGSKRRMRKSDRIDANKLARLGRVDPQSLYPIRHRSREVRQDLVVLRARGLLRRKVVQVHAVPLPYRWNGPNGERRRFERRQFQARTTANNIP